MSQCPACGRALAESDLKCPDCGANVDGITESFPAVSETIEPAGEVAETPEGPVLVVRKGPQVGERFYIDRPRLTLGRSPQSDVFLNDVTVSREHAVVEIKGGEVWIADVGSLNGTYLNGVLVDSASLKTGDVVQIGAFQMVYVSGGGLS